MFAVLTLYSKMAAFVFGETENKELILVFSWNVVTRYLLKTNGFVKFELSQTRGRIRDASADWPE